MKNTARERSAATTQPLRSAGLQSDVLVVRQPVEGQRQFSVADAPASRDLVHGTPWSVPLRIHGQRNRTGDFFFSSTRHHVAYASLEELQLLLALDHQQTVSGILSQPFMLKFVRDDARESHVPDYFVVRGNGDQEVWDVRPLDPIDDRLARKALLTREFCRAVGFQYRVFDGMSSVTKLTLTFLHAYADGRRYRPDPATAVVLLKHFTPESDLRHALGELDAAPRWIRMWVYHMLWCGDLEMDLSKPLSDARKLRAVVG